MFQIGKRQWVFIDSKTYDNTLSPGISKKLIKFKKTKKSLTFDRHKNDATLR